MLLELVVTACLVGKPETAANCRVHTIPVENADNPMGCMMTSPPLLAQWEQDNPRYQVRRWTCRERGKYRDL